jgi:competence protein ComEA
MKKWLNEHFGFTKREFNGLLVLIFVIVLLYFAPTVYRNLFYQSKALNEVERAALSELVLIKDKEHANFYFTKNEIEEKEFNQKVKLFDFDPNIIDVEQWQMLGLSAKQANAIINYRNKGGKFYKTEDLKKMYTISPEKYQQLVPYIKLSSVSSNREQQMAFTPKVSAKKEFKVIELNTADTVNLMNISGVGLAFARRIAKYRNRLGGFYKKEQLLEVYGIDSIKYHEIKDQVMVDADAIQKIQINKVEFDDLKSHPYLNFKQINAIIQYRKQHGKFNSVDDLKKVLILPAQVIQNLSPYLIF